MLWHSHRSLDPADQLREFSIVSYQCSVVQPEFRPLNLLSQLHLRFLPNPVRILCAKLKPILCMANPVKWHFITITIAYVLSGCDDASPVRSTAGPLVRDSVRDSSNSCLLNLKDGTSFELFRSQIHGEGPSHVAITVKHRIGLLQPSSSAAVIVLTGRIPPTTGRTAL